MPIAFPLSAASDAGQVNAGVSQSVQRWGDDRFGPGDRGIGGPFRVLALQAFREKMKINFDFEIFLP